MNFRLIVFKVLAFIAFGFVLIQCQNEKLSFQEIFLENYIRNLPSTEKKIFQNYRRIWLFLANTFAKGDIPTHKDFDSLFCYNRNEEKFLLKTMLIKDSLWNPYAIHFLDTMIKLQYQQNHYQSAGLHLDFHYAEKDSGEKYYHRFKGITHFSITSKYVQKDFFSKYVHEIYPLPLMLDFSMPKKSKSFFCVDFDEVQVADSLYNEFAFQILHHIRWFSEPLMDTIKFKKFLSKEEHNIFLQEFYRIVKLQQMCEMPEEDWQHRSVRPVIDAFILIIAKQQIRNSNIWNETGLNPELIHLGFTTLANQWMNMSPWLHHYITSCLQNIFHYYYPDSQIVLKLPSGKSSIRRKFNAEPILIAPIKVIYHHPARFTQEIWFSLPINPNKYPQFHVIKERTWKK